MVETETHLGGKRTGGGQRGKITGFSAESRLRMLKFMHSITFEGGLLITLTYPKDYPTGAAVYKKHLQNFRRQFEAAYGKNRTIWKLEYQERGAPHYHLLVFDARHVDIKECSWLWYISRGGIYFEGLSNGFDVKSAWKEDGVSNVGAYVGKYISKETLPETEEDLKYTGRFWGYWNMPDVKKYEIEIDPENAENALRAVCGHVGVSGKPYEGFNVLNGTIFTGNVGSAESGKKIVTLLAEQGYNLVNS